MISDYSRIYRDSMQQKKLLQCDIFHQRNSAWPLTWLDQVLCLLTTQQRHLLALPQTLKTSLSQLSSLSKDTGTRLLTWCAKTSCSCQCSAWAGSKMSRSVLAFSHPPSFQIGEIDWCVMTVQDCLCAIKTSKRVFLLFLHLLKFTQHVTDFWLFF